MDDGFGSPGQRQVDLVVTEQAHRVGNGVGPRGAGARERHGRRPGAYLGGQQRRAGVGHDARNGVGGHADRTLYQVTVIQPEQDQDAQAKPIQQMPELHHPVRREAAEGEEADTIGDDDGTEFEDMPDTPGHGVEDLRIEDIKIVGRIENDDRQQPKAEEPAAF